ncbi:EAL domain-containing protein [Methylobacterium sp. BTF04]|uniref:putative bifunctional diguanylate cyclase/phosphodiesterase n=1 Tax=Methylobacterium sp. BTF04 TaxID=2708300 RepID=UPI0013D51A8B|nr:EAL domain-containing protein [Methylobacterium sp. BTF04]NEU13084.1 EAL domain-containing protein [Methylobacterium sp. BTF04]
MPIHRLTSIGGEYASPEREAAFRAERLPETIRHVRLILVVSVVLNGLFLLSDWRFYGTPHFAVAVTARLCVVVASAWCLWAAARATDFPTLQRAMIAWEIATGLAVAFLCSTHSDLALFVALMLPAVFMLALPTRFLWTMICGNACAITLLAVYLLPPPLPSTAIGLVLAVGVSNIAVLLFVMRSNRLRRLEWTATQAERRANDELAASRLLFETMFKAVPVPIVVSRQSDGQIVATNDAGTTFFGVPRGASLTSYRTRDLVDPNDLRLIQALLNERGSARDLELGVNTIGGDRRDILLSVEAVNAYGVPCIISSLVDITSRKAVEERIRVTANHDVLTGLPNRALFQATLDTVLASAEATQGQVGLIILDLDAFKEVNDTLGHEAGDTLLKEVGQRLSGAVAPGDLVARLGGDEFVIIAPSGGRDARPRCIHDLAANILAALSPTMPVAGRILAPRASLGLALYPEHAANPTDLFTNADLALYAAKASGRNRATLFVPALRASIEDRVTVAREMRSALVEGGLIPFYQPKVNLATGAVVGFEALARWEHPTRGLLAPAAFATVFDDSEIGMAVGQCLMRKIFADVAGWIALGLDPGRVFLNLSSAQFAQGDLAERLLADLDSAGLPRDRIGIEVTETVLLGGHGDRVSPVLDTLHAAGIRVALDDFGTGYASLTHLKQYPVDEIKIDRSFVRDLERDANDAAIVAAVLQLGHSLRIDVTAEGVETEAQALFLEREGCTFVQGYLYSKPMPKSRVPWFLQNRPDLASRAEADAVRRQA